MSDTNRIGDACWFSVLQYSKTHKRLVDDWRRGVLRAWSVDHIEMDGGPGNFAAAVVEEITTMRVHVVRADLVSFASISPGGENERPGSLELRGDPRQV